MKLSTLLLAGALSLGATAAFAQVAEPGRPDTRTDDQSCSAKAEAAQRARANADSGAIPTKGLSPAEEEFLKKCGVAVEVPPPPPPPVAMVEPAPAPAPAAPPSRLYSSDYNPATPATTVTTVTNGPVPDTPENRARFGGPMSRGGQKTVPVGN